MILNKQCEVEKINEETGKVETDGSLCRGASDQECPNCQFFLFKNDNLGTIGKATEAVREQCFHSLKFST